MNSMSRNVVLLAVPLGHTWGPHQLFKNEKMGPPNSTIEFWVNFVDI